jgi:hypothetical protein
MLGSEGHVLAIEVITTLMREEILNRVVVFADFSGRKITMISRGLRTGSPPECRGSAGLRLMPWPVGREIPHQTVRSYCTANAV